MNDRNLMTLTATFRRSGDARRSLRALQDSGYSAPRMVEPTAGLNLDRVELMKGASTVLGWLGLVAGTVAGLSLLVTTGTTGAIDANTVSACLFGGGLAGGTVGALVGAVRGFSIATRGYQLTVQAPLSRFEQARRLLERHQPEGIQTSTSRTNRS